MLDPAAILRVLEPLADPAVDIGTIAIEIRDEAERDNPNMVKAVAALGADTPIARALYFTRARCPVRARSAFPPYRHLCLSPRGAGALRQTAAGQARTMGETGAVARA